MAVFSDDVPGGCGKADHGFQRSRHGARLADRCIDVGEERRGIGHVEIHDLCGVHDTAAADRDVAIRCEGRGELDGCLNRGIGGFDADVLKNSDFDLFAADECSRALGKSCRFDTGVRDNEHALQAQRRNVVADFLRRSHAEFVGRGSHGKHGVFHLNSIGSDRADSRIIRDCCSTGISSHAFSMRSVEGRGDPGYCFAQPGANGRAALSGCCWFARRRREGNSPPVSEA